jgi:hypothetical protein
MTSWEERHSVAIFPDNEPTRNRWQMSRSSSQRAIPIRALSSTRKSVKAQALFPARTAHCESSDRARASHRLRPRAIFHRERARVKQGSQDSRGQRDREGMAI